ncbi:PucR family transcriptional regulator [Prauserella cavernicola]|uniref:Helix-turn-helix domain-containing protein n=1 Tax=Prauserella cavernicola TaxID=2800127 RepID=A0A934V3Z5_9PSEU|nr:helix-turn-helix domain-containing protein [Prauserella cavernicola]MBK1787826.1 helix-turn-helix domain-containing protein [Prauserella cavernicola]
MTGSQRGFEDPEEIGRLLTETICAQHPDYAALSPEVYADVVDANVQNARLYAYVVLEDKRPTPAQLASLADAARRRVGQGVTLESLLRAYRIGARRMWKEMSERRPDLDQHALTDLTLNYIDWISTTGEHAYLGEQRRLLASGHDRTRLSLGALVEDHFTTDDERDAAVGELGLDPAGAHVGAVIAGAHTGVAVPVEQLWGVLQSVRRSAPTSVAAVLPRGAVVLFPASATTGISELLHRALQSASGPHADVLRAGVGEPRAGAAQIAATVREAERALLLGGILHPGKPVHGYEDIRFFDLFRQGEPVDEFVRVVLGEQLKADRAGRGRLDMIKTLYVWFTLGMNRKASAERLGVHPNTLDNRLRQATNLFGVDVTSPEQSFRFQLAVRLIPLCNRAEWLDGPPALADILGDEGA